MVNDFSEEPLFASKAGEYHADLYFAFILRRDWPYAILCVR